MKYIQLTAGEDGDRIKISTPSSKHNCKFMGYNIHNTAIDGGFQYQVNSMLNGQEINIPLSISFNIDKVKEYLANHYPDITKDIENTRIQVKTKALAQKIKNEAKYYGFSSTTYYKTKRIVEVKDNPMLTEQLVKLALTAKNTLCSTKERAYCIHALFQMGVINKTKLPKI